MCAHLHTLSSCAQVCATRRAPPHNHTHTPLGAAEHAWAQPPQRAARCGVGLFDALTHLRPGLLAKRAATLILVVLFVLFVLSAGGTLMLAAAASLSGLGCLSFTWGWGFSWGWGRGGAPLLFYSFVIAKALSNFFLPVSYLSQHLGPVVVVRRARGTRRGRVTLPRRADHSKKYILKSPRVLQRPGVW